MVERLDGDVAVIKSNEAEVAERAAEVADDIGAVAIKGPHENVVPDATYVKGEQLGWGC